MKKLVVALALILAVLSSSTVLANGDIKVTSQTQENHFPKDITFKLQAEASQEIRRITLFYKIGSGNVTSYAYLTFTPGPSVQGEYALPTSGAQTYIPAGSEVEYYYEIEDAAGNKLKTEPARLTYTDTRFKWQEIEGSQLTVFWYAQEQAARKVFQVGEATLDKMKTQAGQSLERPVKIFVYGSKQEMDVALPFRSQATTTDIVTQGTAFSESDEVMILGSDREIEATTAHELTHLITDQLTSNAFSSIPAWLNEGLSMYAEGELRRANQEALDNAIRQNTLLRIRAISSPAGRPEEVNLFYGQAYSIVRYLVDTYGSTKMSELLAVFKQGTNTSDALMKVYQFDVDGLEQEWRAAIGARPVESASTQQVEPQKVPTIVPFGSKQPQTAPTAQQPQEQIGGVNIFVALVSIVAVLTIASAVVLTLVRRR